MNVAPQKSMLAAAALLFALAGCSTGTQFGGKKAGKEKEEDKGDVDDTVDDPQQVAGAFLCGLQDEGQATAQSTPIGCGVYDDEDRKMIDKNVTYELVVEDEKGDEVPLKTDMAPASSKWMVLAQLPNAYKSTGKLMLMSSKSGDSAPQGADTPEGSLESMEMIGSMATGDIGKSLDEMTSGMALSQIIFHASWDPKDPQAWSAQGIDTNDFCAASGTIMNSLSNAVSIEAITSAVGIDINLEIVHRPAKAQVVMAFCLQPFTDLWNTGKGNGYYLFGAGGCLFVKANNKLFIASPHGGYNDWPGVQTNIEEFSKALSCK